MAKCISINEIGGPDVLNYHDIDVGSLETGHVKLRHTAIGLNYIDIYFRTGLYPIDKFPQTLGMEAAGIIESIGPEITNFNIGDRVAYPMSIGAYSSERNIEASKLVKIPNNITDKNAAAIMLKGLTAYYLLHRTYRVMADDYILVYAAAGGVGSILCQWAKSLGARVIGCVGSSKKAEIAKNNGCDFPILYKSENVAECVKEITQGQGVSVAYDSVGENTLNSSLDSLKTFGTLVSFGNSSGTIKNFDPTILAKKGSLFLTRPTLASHIATPELLHESTKALFKIVSDGTLKIEIGQTYKLENTKQAHIDLESRKTTGSTLIMPWVN